LFHKTYANTEASYLLVKHAFDDLGYHRVEWKCGKNKATKQNNNKKKTQKKRENRKRGKQKRSFSFFFGTDNDNRASFNAALNLGFVFEGVFRKHMIVKRKNRDTAWFSIIDSDWKQTKRNLEDRIFATNYQLASQVVKWRKERYEFLSFQFQFFVEFLFLFCCFFFFFSN
jgi:hypothetical protein